MCDYYILSDDAKYASNETAVQVAGNGADEENKSSKPIDLSPRNCKPVRVECGKSAVSPLLCSRETALTSNNTQLSSMNVDSEDCDAATSIPFWLSVPECAIQCWTGFWQNSIEKHA